VPAELLCVLKHLSASKDASHLDDALQTHLTVAAPNDRLTQCFREASCFLADVRQGGLVQGFQLILCARETVEGVEGAVALIATLSRWSR
jgi:hypothetical protein